MGLLHNVWVLFHQNAVHNEGASKMAETCVCDAGLRAELGDKAGQVTVEGLAVYLPKRVTFKNVMKSAVRLICTTENALQTSMFVESPSSGPRIQKGLNNGGGHDSFSGNQMLTSEVPQIVSVKICRGPFPSTAAEQLNPIRSSELGLRVW